MEWGFIVAGLARGLRPAAPRGALKMEMRKMMMMAAVAFFVSFAAAYLAAAWVTQTVTDTKTEQVETREQTAVVLLEC